MQLTSRYLVMQRISGIYCRHCLFITKSDEAVSTCTNNLCFFREARRPSGRALDSGARGRGFDPHSGRRVVSLSKIHLPPSIYPQKVLVIPRKRRLRPDMTEKLLTGT